MFGHQKHKAILTTDFGFLLQHVQHHLQREGPAALKYLGCLFGLLFDNEKLLKFRPRALLVGGPLDVQEDVFHLARSRRHLQSGGLQQWLQAQPDEILNQVERERVNAYVEHWLQRPHTVRCDFQDLAFHLGDEPRGGWVTTSATSHVLPTLRRSGSLYYSPFVQRQFLLRELYAAHGFPTFPALAREARVPVYQVFKPSLTYTHMRQALGNAQIVPQVGVFTACALASLKPLQG